MDENSSPSVKLIVKASNQQFDDQTINCEQNWTVKKLKEHLSLVYPCKPRVTDQKLIYAGQLLQDNLILKDILRSYEETTTQIQTHIFHLVYSPKMKPIPTSQTQRQTPATQADGLRQRNVQRTDTMEATNSTIPNNIIPQMMAAAASTGQTSNVLNCPTNNFNGGLPFGLNAASQSTNEYMMAQQMAMHNWMQQVYVQYMNQFVNFSTFGSVRPDMQNSMPPASHISGNMPQMPYMPQNFPSFGNFGPQFGVPNASPYGQTVPNNFGTAEVGQHQQQHAGVPVIANGMQQAQPGGPGVAAVVQEPQPQPAQPRFPNIVQEEPENRDWLDIFYSISRLMVLLTLVYFYSSPLRCLVVIIVGLGIYLYHIGVFRTRNQAEANNNNRNNVNNNRQGDNNNPPAVANNDEAAQEQEPMEHMRGPAIYVGDRQQMQQQPQREAGENNPPTPNIRIEGTNIVPEAEHNGTSVIAFVRTFVFSFFTSLLPDAPPTL